MTEADSRPGVGRRDDVTNYGDPGFSRFMRRAFAKGMGYTGDDLQRPVIGICNSWSELNHCNRHLRQVADAVKRGVWAAGGWPMEFPTISLGEIFTSPTAMLYRNLMALDAEEMSSAQPVDGVIFLANCDKTTPAYLMAAASADLPAMVFTGGPMFNGRWRGQDLGACTDCRRYWTEYRAGDLSTSDLNELEDALFRSTGHCMVMGTASTMAAITEGLGMTLPGAAAIPAADSARFRLAEEAGRRMVGIVDEDLRPSKVLTPAAFDNAIRVLMAVGGSTNAVIHLIAVAGRLGIDLPLDRFDRLSRETPLIASMRPTGRFQMEELYEAGGVPAVMRELASTPGRRCPDSHRPHDHGELGEYSPFGDARGDRAARHPTLSGGRPGHPVRESRAKWSGDQARSGIVQPPTASRARGGLPLSGGYDRQSQRPGPRCAS